MEIHAQDLQQFHNWRKHSHKDAISMALTWSHHIHLQAVTLSRNEGATAAQIIRREDHIATLPGSTNNLLKPCCLPSSRSKDMREYRKPILANVENIMPASQRQQHYAKNAFASVSLFAENTANQVVLFVPPSQILLKLLTCEVTGTILIRQTAQAKSCMQLQILSAKALLYCMVPPAVSSWMPHVEE